MSGINWALATPNIWRVQDNPPAFEGIPDTFHFMLEETLNQPSRKASDPPPPRGITVASSKDSHLRPDYTFIPSVLSCSAPIKFGHHNVKHDAGPHMSLSALGSSTLPCCLGFRHPSRVIWKFLGSWPSTRMRRKYKAQTKPLPKFNSFLGRTLECTQTTCLNYAS